MTIEEIIKNLPAPICCDTVIGKTKQKEYDAHDSAIIILRKYQKIEQIMKKRRGKYFIEIVQEIKEVLEDGKDD